MMLRVEEKNEKMKKSIWLSFLPSFLLIVFAFILLYKEDDFLETFVLILGYFLMIFGSLRLVFYLRLKEEQRRENNDILEGIIFFFFGLIAILKNSVLAGMLAYLLGAYYIVKNAYRLQISLDFKFNSQNSFWYYVAIISGIGVLLGAFIILNPFEEIISISKMIAYCTFIIECISIFQNITILIGMAKKNESK